MEKKEGETFKMKKKISSGIFYTASLGILTLLAVCALRQDLSRGYSAFRDKHTLQPFPRFKTADVAQLQIRWKNIESTMIRKNGRWLLLQRGSMPASENRINNLISALNSVSPVKELHGRSADLLEDLHLTGGDSATEKIPGVSVTLKNASGKELFRILLGKGHFLRPEEGTTQRGNAEGRYVLVNGKVYLIPLVFEECHPVPSAWVEALQLKDLQKSLLMTAWKIPANQTKAQILFQVFRRSTAHPFTLLQPRDKGKQADNAILSGIAAELSKPFTGDYFTGDVNALAGKESVFLLIRTSDGFQYRLQVIEHNAQTDVVSLAVQYDPAKVLPVPGESPQNLAERKKILAKRFEEEKFYTEGKLFLTGKQLKKRLLIPPVKKKVPTTNGKIGGQQKNQAAETAGK